MSLFEYNFLFNRCFLIKPQPLMNPLRNLAENYSNSKKLIDLIKI